MGEAITAKQEAWAQLVGGGATYSAAYRSVYDAANMAQKTIWEEASRLASDPKVSARVCELQEAAAERTFVSVQSITDELEAARKKASDLDQPAAMTSAIMGKAKVNGLLVDKQEHIGGISLTINQDDAEL